uniref:Uncharacterized protein n=1 Tax=viral metagenome TaxID=1070528 RepID=A0A6H2A1L3_9ZZZZ
MITEENSNYKKYRAELGFDKFPDYLKWYHNQINRGYDLHHLLGSETGKKHTDALVYHFPYEFHLRIVDKNRSKYFELYLEQSVKMFEKWICIKLGGILPLRLDLSPGSIQKRIDLVKTILLNGY